MSTLIILLTLFGAIAVAFDNDYLACGSFLGAGAIGLIL